MKKIDSKKWFFTILAVTFSALIANAQNPTKPRILVEDGTGYLNLSGLICNQLNTFGRAELVPAIEAQVGGELTIGDKPSSTRLDAAREAGFGYIFTVSCKPPMQKYMTTSSKDKKSGKVTTYHHYTAEQHYYMYIHNTSNHELVQSMHDLKMHGNITTIRGNYDYRNTVVEKVKKYFPVFFRRFINRTFPVQGTVTNVEPGEKKKDMQITIALGLANGVSAGDELEVYVDKEKKNEVIKDRIGKTIVVNATEKTATCKVTKGNSKIEKAFKKNTPMIVSDNKKINKSQTGKSEDDEDNEDNEVGDKE